MTPGTPPADHLGLEEPDHRLRQGIVVAVAEAADRRLDAGLGKPLGIADRDILTAAIAMVHQAVKEGAPVVERLFQGIEDKAGLGRSRNPPADDAAGEGIDDEGNVDKPLPGRDIGEVRHPQRIGRGPRNWRFTLSRGQGAAGLPIVVFIALPRIAPDSPICRISRAVVQRATAISSRPSRRQTLRTP